MANCEKATSVGAATAPPPVSSSRTAPAESNVAWVKHVTMSVGSWPSDLRQTQHNTTQHNTTQHNTTQHNTTQHNTTQHNTIPKPHASARTFTYERGTHNTHTVANTVAQSACREVGIVGGGGGGGGGGRG